MACAGLVAERFQRCRLGRRRARVASRIAPWMRESRQRGRCTWAPKSPDASPPDMRFERVVRLLIQRNRKDGQVGRGSHSRAMLWIVTSRRQTCGGRVLSCIAGKAAYLDPHEE